MKSKWLLLIAAVVGLIAFVRHKQKPKVAPEGSKPPGPDGIGDVNRDGYVTIEDADLIGQYVVGNVALTDDQIRRADVNHDGKVDIGDSLLIARYLNGQVATL